MESRVVKVDPSSDGTNVLVWVFGSQQFERMYLRRGCWYYSRNGQTYGSISAIDVWWPMPDIPKELLTGM